MIRSAIIIGGGVGTSFGKLKQAKFFKKYFKEV